MERQVEPVKALISLGKMAVSEFESGDVARKRELLRALTLNPTVSQRKLRIIAKKPLEQMPQRPDSTTRWRWREFNPRLADRDLSDYMRSCA